MRRCGPGLALFLAFQGLFVLTASGRVNRVPDEFEVYQQVESLWDRGSLAIPQCPRPLFFGKLGRDGQAYAPYGPGMAFLALPHHALGRASAALLGIDRETDIAGWTEWVAAITSLASATWAALAVLGLFRAALALGAGTPRAALVAALLGGATLLWPYATFFFSEAAAAAALIWAVAWWLEDRPGLASVAALVLFLIKATNLILWPALLLLAAGRERPRSARELLDRTFPFLLAGLLALGIHATWNWYRFGSIRDFGYAWTEFLRPGEPPRPFLLSELPRGLFGLLLSPGKSLFLFAPPLLLACARLGALRRERPELFRAWCAALAAGLLVFGSYFYWEGGYCFGPRHLVPLVPLLLLPLALGPPPRRALLMAVVALGVSVQLLGVSVSFLEDQARGMRERREGDYYANDPGVPSGRPTNVYRLGYTPFASYPPLLLRHLRGAPGSGTSGLELLPLHLLRVRARVAGIPLVGVWAVPLLGLLLVLGAGVVKYREPSADGERGPPEVSG